MSEQERSLVEEDEARWIAEQQRLGPSEGGHQPMTAAPEVQRPDTVGPTDRNAREPGGDKSGLRS